MMPRISTGQGPLERRRSGRARWRLSSAHAYLSGPLRGLRPIGSCTRARIATSRRLRRIWATLTKNEVGQDCGTVFDGNRFYNRPYREGPSSSSFSVSRRRRRRCELRSFAPLLLRLASRFSSPSPAGSPSYRSTRAARTGRTRDADESSHSS